MMWLWMVLCQVSTALVGGTFDIGTYKQRRHYAPATETNCFEYSELNPNGISLYNKGWRQKTSFSENSVTASTFPMKLKTNEGISRRFDILLPKSGDIVKEHAKLVQDINGLRQIVFVAPFRDESKDDDYSIFHDIIETSTTPKPTSTRAPVGPTKPSSIPVILLGGASHRQVVKSQPIQFAKPTISLLRTTASPLKHPYPFVIKKQESRRPIKICMTSIPVIYTTIPRRPSLWQRLIHSIIPR